MPCCEYAHARSELPEIKQSRKRGIASIEQHKGRTKPNIATERRCKRNVRGLRTWRAAAALPCAEHRLFSVRARAGQELPVRADGSPRFPGTPEVAGAVSWLQHCFDSPGALWDRAALELRHSRRTVAQAPLWGKAGRGRACTGKGSLSPGRLKVLPGGCRKVRSESGALEGPGKLSWGQQGRPLLWNMWSGAQLQGRRVSDPLYLETVGHLSNSVYLADGEGPWGPRDEAITTCVLGQALKNSLEVCAAK
ncbi:hypothetical protein NDU88_004547 [Pleurodeles waltl]|uniref:Uncharacterized protein n=1 Tax=Pleurodeles waltl TaxID=8319 RepID=A0AAV7WSA0_PLEWA|nr:hypothetical protein NDU88_004547 [Pleurodeles waltl]